MGYRIRMSKNMNGDKFIVATIASYFVPIVFLTRGTA